MPSAIETIIRQARWRLAATRFLQRLILCLSGGLVLGALVLAIARMAGLTLSPVSVAVSSVAAGFLSAIAWTVFRSPKRLDAALALDHSLDLKERLSTLVALDDESRASDVGQALAHDVERKLGAVRLGDRLPIALPRRAWAPLVPLAALIAVGAMVGPIGWTTKAEAETATPEEREQIAREAKVLEKKVAAREKEIADAKLDQELQEITAKINQSTRELTEKKEGGTKDALAKLGELSREVDQRKKQLESLDAMKRELAKLSRGKEGPASALADALKKGDFAQAADEMKKLADQLNNGQMPAEQKRELASKLNELKNQLERLSKLSDRAEQLKKSLPPDALGKELERLKQDAHQLKRLEELAKQLGQCAACQGKEGGEKELEAALAEACRQADALAREQRLGEMLDDLRDDLDACKNGVCQKPGGGKSGTKPGTQRGPAGGERPPSDDTVTSRPQRAPTKPRAGDLTVMGRLPGGSSKEESAIEPGQQVAGATRAADEAITRQRIPTEYKKHARDYFDRLNGVLKD